MFVKYWYYLILTLLHFLTTVLTVRLIYCNISSLLAFQKIRQLLVFFLLLILGQERELLSEWVYLLVDTGLYGWALWKIAAKAKAGMDMGLKKDQHLERNASGTDGLVPIYE